MLLVPLTVVVGTTDGYSVTDESSILSGNGNQSSFFDSETDSESGSADNPVITSGLDYFYDDGKGMWWTFRIVGNSEAAITGGYCTNNNMTSLNIPESVIDNASFRSDATIIVEDHPEIGKYKDADHILLKLQVRLYNNLFDSSFKIKIDKEGSSEITVSSDELVTAGSDLKAYTISANGKIIIKDVTAVKLADVYYCDKADSPIIAHDDKGNEYTLGPASASINVQIPKSLVSKSNDESYSVVSIADNAFKTLGTQESSFSSIVGNKDKNQFYEKTNLYSIVIPRSVVSIGDNAFSEVSKNLTTISFSEASSLQSIGVNAFFGCGSTDKPAEIKDSVEFEEIKSGKIYCDVDGTLTIKMKTNTEQTFKIAHCAGFSDWKKTSEYVILSCTKSNGYECSYVFSVKDQKWNECKENHKYYLFNTTSFNKKYQIIPIDRNYLQVEIPNTVKSIGDGAFTNVQKVTFEKGSNLEYLGSNVFEHLYWPVTFPGTIQTIGVKPFNYVEGHSIDENGNGLRTIDGFVMSGSELVAYFGNETNLSVDHFNKAGVESVRDYAFENTSIQSIVIPDGVEWGLFPFKGCSKLKTVDFTKVSDIPDYLMGYSGLEDIQIPSNIVTIGEKAFYKLDSLKSVTISENNNLENIGQYSFSSNPELLSVSFGSSSNGVLCTIDDCAFFNCSKLASISVSSESNLVYIGNEAFAKVATSEKELSAVRMGDVAFVIPSTVTYIGDYAFACIDAKLSSGSEPGCNMLGYVNGSVSSNAGFTEICADDGSALISIGSNAFSSLSGVLKLDLSNCGKLESLEKNAFKTGTIKEIILPDTGILKRISSFSSIGETGSIESYVVPAYVEEVGNLSVFNSVSFAEGSKLRIFNPDDPEQHYTYDKSTEKYNFTHTTDLSNCHMLQTVFCVGVMTLPPGVYGIDGVIYEISNRGEVASPSGDDLVIKSSTIAINKNKIGKGKIDIESENNNFRLDGNNLIYTTGMETILLGVSNDVKAVSISSDSSITSIADQAFRWNKIDSIAICKSGITVGNEIFIGNNAEEVDVFLTPDDIRMSVDSFRGDYSKIRFYVNKALNYSDLEILGDVYLGVILDGGAIYFPQVAFNAENSEYVALKYGDVTDAGIISVDLSGGYTLHDLILTYGADSSVGISDGSHLDLNDLAFGESDHLIIDVAVKARHSDDDVLVTFDGNGGMSSGDEQKVIGIGRGLTLIDSDFPTFVRSNYDFIGWFTNSDEVYDRDSVLTADLVLQAKWASRNPTITVRTEAGEVRNGNDAVTVLSMVPGANITLSFSPFKGYDVKNWVVDGVETHSALDDLTLTVNEDVTISVTYRYYSQSSGLNPISYKGLPTSDTISKAVQSWTAGGHVDMSGAVWSGHASVPLIVDDHVFTRVGTYIYKIESDTGYVLGCVASKSANTYYHYLGYGNGLIVDTLTGNVYDTDLKLRFSIDGLFSGVEYYDGYFYTSGTTLYRFSADPNDASESKRMAVEKVGVFDNTVYSSYGFSSSVFEDGYIYRVFAQGSSRGITAMCIDSKAADYGKSSSIVLNGISSMYLDDGWISYHNGVLYLPGYTVGLFGAIATSGNSALSYVKVNGLQFGDQSSYVFDQTRSFVSQFVVCDGYGYVNAGGILYVFKMNSDGTPGSSPVTSCLSTMSHGSITLEKSYSTEDNGYQTYVYLIPYYTDSNEIIVLSGHEVEGGYEMTRVESNNFLKNYNSQAIRADNEGRMTWYNDSGQIYSYTIPEKNRFFFFIDDGSNAIWYESYGASAAKALESLGSDVVTLSKSNSLLTVNGSDVDDSWSIYYLKRTIPDVLSSMGASGSEKSNWVEIDNLYNRSLNVYHYYLITSVDIPAAGAGYSYISGESTGKYSFADNVGDRSIVGKKMVKGTENVVTIRFYDRGEEVKDSALIGIVGEDVKGSLPMVYRMGYIGYWVEAGSDEAVSSFSGTRYTGDKNYEMKWIEVSVSYTISMDAAYEGGQIFLNLTTTRTKGSEDLPDAHILLVSTYDKGVVVNSYTDKLNMVDGTAHAKLGISQSHLVSVHVFIVNGTPAVGSFMNYGMSVFDPAG